MGEWTRVNGRNTEWLRRVLQLCSMSQSGRLEMLLGMESFSFKGREKHWSAAATWTRFPDRVSQGSPVVPRSRQKVEVRRFAD